MAIEVKVKIEGISDYLQHKRPFEEDETLKKRTGEIDYSKEAEKTVYRDEDLGCYIPSKQIRACLVKAGATFKVTGGRGRTFKNMINAVIEVEPDKIPLKKKNFDYVHQEFVKLRGSDQILRSRPAFEKGWEAEFSLLILDEEQIPVKIMKQIAEYGGKFVGIGDWRPHFGRFEVVEFK